MIEVTCGACGAVQRFAESDVPPTGKVTSCTSCKAKLTVVPPAPNAGGGVGDIIDLGTLTPSSRKSPLAGAVAAPKPSGAQKLPPSPGKGGPTGQPATTQMGLGRGMAPATSDPFSFDALGKTGGVSEIDERDAVDLPAPVGPAPSRRGPGEIDLPAPKRSASSDDGIDNPTLRPYVADLPAPVGPSSRNLDLPAPVGPSGRNLDLPAPVGPSSRNLDLPAPVGPTSRSSGLPAPVGASSRNSGLPAPKGFFDDAPVPSPLGPGGTVKGGFFDDIPMPTKTLGEPAGRGGGAAGGGGLDLDALDLAPSTIRPGKVDAAAPAKPGKAAAVAHSSAAELDLDAGPGADGGGDPYGGLDLPSVAVKMPTAQAAPATGSPSFKQALDLGDQHSHAAIDLLETSGAKPMPKKPAPVKKVDPAVAADKPRIARKQKIMLASIATVVVLGGVGGFIFYSRWQDAKERAATVASDLQRARAALADATPGHWQSAVKLASHAISIESSNVEAKAIAAQANLAGFLDEGTDQERRITAGSRLAQEVIASGAKGPDVDKTFALKAIIDNTPDQAVRRLTALAGSDPDAQLYLAWAHLAKSNYAAAIATFDQALARGPKRDIPLLYGRGIAKLGLGDREGARGDFGKVLEKNKDHISAQVALAASAPPGDFARREADVLALLQRQDIEGADPRAVARAWTLAGDDARRAGRLDAARERYRKAMALYPDFIGASLGIAETEIRASNLEAATTAVERVLSRNADDVAANLVAVELDIRRDRIPEAKTRLDALRGRTPPLESPRDRARLALLNGMLLEKEPGKDNDALAAYEEAKGLSDETDVTPAIAMATLLGRMADKVAKGKEKGDVAALRTRADSVLGPIAARADSDASLALTLGVAYLDAGDAAKAEIWLRNVLTTRPTDVEAHFQLAAALDRQGKRQDSLQVLRKAFDLDPQRVDVGLELARSYENAGRADEAGAMFDKLLAGKDVSIDLRGRAGRFWARNGDITRARAQGEMILEVEDKNPAGLFLRGEGLYADRKFAEARRQFQQAIEGAEEAQYFDALGRAAEMIGTQDGDSRFKEEALRSYIRANELDPKMLSAMIGRGRIHLERRDPAKALAALNEALALKPNDADILYGIGVAHHELGDRKGAIQWLTRANQARPIAEAFYRIGLISYDLDRGSDAAAALWQATRYAAEDEKKLGRDVAWLTEAFYLLGSIESSLHRDAGAKRAWETFLARNPANKAQVDEVKRMMLGLRGR